MIGVRASGRCLIEGLRLSRTDIAWEVLLLLLQLLSYCAKLALRLPGRGDAGSGISTWHQTHSIRYTHHSRAALQYTRLQCLHAGREHVACHAAEAFAAVRPVLYHACSG